MTALSFLPAGETTTLLLAHRIGQLPGLEARLGEIRSAADRAERGRPRAGVGVVAAWSDMEVGGVHRSQRSQQQGGGAGYESVSCCFVHWGILFRT